jgi:hypothetical protein
VSRFRQQNLLPAAQSEEARVEAEIARLEPNKE